MVKQFEIVFETGGISVVANLVEEKAPITCENFWHAIVDPITQDLHHGGETGPEMWCFVPEPQEEIPYENSTVFPEHGDILYYHYRQPPTRDGEMVYDIGIYWDRGQSKLAQGWIAGNLFAKIVDREHRALLRREAGLLLSGEGDRVTLGRKT
ncbi:MAG: DUF3830 family protein [Planctomycetes bacterium]|nr:DUF3830 family protein [Planctomycetota bacterium]